MPGNRPFKLGHAGNRHFNRLVLASPEPRGRVTKRLAARWYTHVLGHNFAPFAFQKPRLGLCRKPRMTPSRDYDEQRLGILYSLLKSEYLR
jgi:hypothetical protein